MKARRAHQRNDCDKKSSNEERDKESSNEERDKEVQKVMDQTLIREIEYILVFLAIIFVSYLIYVINLVSKPPA
eukprot:CAMPEP_0114430516 /NCGR_PEP_ID=MMETSP0103-20121206/10083_1 /TAXON_ID=37642 ORGANISM="Paraphysomonas imperforata, Strain PA2" /NCGR_SAMPLE_ID=MMETSP0103 /ASSEMBLY_ACC=CAM_ASM_000201 /LENGTH=73 /DNA_ID=CAMNT_0001599969 /DNA_START=262 /DNA_END=483 /DNA_ORIENTATION=-